MKKRASHRHVKLFFAFHVPMLLILSALGILGCSSGNSTLVTGKTSVKEPPVMVLFPPELSGLMAGLKSGFTQTYTQKDLKLSPSPERAFAEKLKQTSNRIDVVLATDTATLQSECIAKGYSDFATAFATDEMVIVWSERSRLSDKIKIDNWHHVLAKSQVVLGLPDSGSDVIGKRVILVLRLADNYYRSTIRGKTIEETILTKKQLISRTSANQLLPLLSTGTIDYTFTYRSIAEKQRLPYLRLRKQVNLSDWAMTKTYARARYKDTPGQVISLAFSIEKTSLATSRGTAFANFLLSEKGMSIINDFGFTALSGGATTFSTAPVEYPWQKWDNSEPE